MALDVKWLLHSKIIQVNISDNISVDDVTHLSNSILAFFEQSDSPLIHILVKKEGSGTLPKSLTSVIEGTKFLRHEQMGWFIIYGNMEKEKIAVFFSTVITGVTKARHRRYDTLKESLAFLTSVDSSLPPLESLL